MEVLTLGRERRRRNRSESVFSVTWGEIVGGETSAMAENYSLIGSWGSVITSVNVLWK